MKNTDRYLEKKLAKTCAEISELDIHNKQAILEEIHHAMDDVGIGIHIVHLDGQLAYVNDAASAMLGYTSHEMLSMKVHDIDPNIPKDTFAEISRPMRDRPGQLETTQRTKDGKIIPVEVTFKYISDDGKPPGYFIAFLKDLSKSKQAEKERYRLQKQLQQLQKMESIGQLTGGIAHDFNNMLAAILGFSHLIKNLLKENEIKKDKAELYINEIVGAGNRAKELISQMLTFSRSFHEQALDNVPVILLDPVIKEVTNLLRSSIPSSIKLDHHIEDNSLKAAIDPLHLRQIILNLGVNARDAINEYGQITISLTQHKHSGYCYSCHDSYNGKYIDISVTDSGTGINKDILNRIFDPFFSTKEVNKGSGMGLSVVHGLVHDAGGHISISSKEKQGTTVSILLPISNHNTDDTNLQESYRQDMDTPLYGKKIMVVDDEHMITSMLSELLTMYGAEVMTFNDSMNALGNFMNMADDIDLIITDETMPELSGLDMSRHLLNRRPDLPIIICTGHSEYINPTIAEESGITEFMLKPLDLDKLLDIIVRLVKTKH